MSILRRVHYKQAATCDEPQKQPRRVVVAFSRALIKWAEEEIRKSRWLQWYFPTMTPWKPCFRNFDQSCEPFARSAIRTPSWFFLSWEKFDQNKSQMGGDPA